MLFDRVWTHSFSFTIIYAFSFDYFRSCLYVRLLSSHCYCNIAINRLGLKSLKNKRKQIFCQNEEDANYWKAYKVRVIRCLLLCPPPPMSVLASAYLFVCTLIYELLDGFNQNCTDTLLGQLKGMIRFSRRWPNIQLHQTHNLGCTTLFLSNRSTLTLLHSYRIIALQLLLFFSI